MTGELIGQLVLWLILAVIVIFILYWVMNWLYRRSTKEIAFVRTGFLGEKVVIDGGAFVWPIIHDITPVNMNTLQLEVVRDREDAVITKDRLRVDVEAEVVGGGVVLGYRPGMSARAPRRSRKAGEIRGVERAAVHSGLGRAPNPAPAPAPPWSNRGVMGDRSVEELRGEPERHRAFPFGGTEVAELFVLPPARDG